MRGNINRWLSSTPVKAAHRARQQNALLEHYVKRPDVIALTFAVDYWDYLGWKDTFSIPLSSKRQRQYAYARGDGSVYNPQAVINGLNHANGASKYSIDRYIKTTKSTLVNQRIPVKLYPQGDQIIVEAGAAHSAVKQNATLWLALVQDEGKVKNSAR